MILLAQFMCNLNSRTFRPALPIFSNPMIKEVNIPFPIIATTDEHTDNEGGMVGLIPRSTQNTKTGSFPLFSEKRRTKNGRSHYIMQ